MWVLSPTGVVHGFIYLSQMSCYYGSVIVPLPNTPPKAMIPSAEFCILYNYRVWVWIIDFLYERKSGLALEREMRT